MSTTFGININRPDGTISEPIVVARRFGKKVIVTNDVFWLLPDDYPVYALDNSPQSINFVIDVKKAMYPFKEGDDYYTVINGGIVRSCWDDTSEEIYNNNPNKRYWYIDNDILIEKKLNKFCIIK